MIPQTDAPEGIYTRPEIQELAYGVIRTQSYPDPAIERLIDHLQTIQAQGYRLGYETNVWHENAKLNGHRCNCVLCWY